jgi:hypothetical protein
MKTVFAILCLMSVSAVADLKCVVQEISGGQNYSQELVLAATSDSHSYIHQLALLSPLKDLLGGWISFDGQFVIISLWHRTAPVVSTMHAEFKGSYFHHQMIIAVESPEGILIDCAPVN